MAWWSVVEKPWCSVHAGLTLRLGLRMEMHV